MRGHNFKAGALALALAAASVPSFAQHSGTPPGDPCGDGPGVATGNPCNGNNGNDGGNGNAGGGDGIVIVRDPPAAVVAMPAVSNRSAYVEQIGDGNRATIEQTAPNAYARIDQRSDTNRATVVQQGVGTSYAHLTQQVGDANFASARQDGPGQNVLYLTQNGAANTATVSQFAGFGGGNNGAELVQNGSAHTLNLTQSGNDNHAMLEQRGLGNTLNVTQNGDKQLTMVQDGQGLGFTLEQEHPRLMITQVNPHGS
jgi:hypothetical protein